FLSLSPVVFYLFLPSLSGAESFCRIAVAIARFSSNLERNLFGALTGSGASITAQSCSMAMTHFATLLRNKGKLKEALALNKESVDLQIAAGNLVESSGYAASLASTYSDMGEVREADVIAERSINWLRSAYNKNPSKNLSMHLAKALAFR